MSGDTILRVSGLSKKFTPQLRRSLAYGMRDIARELLPGAGPRPHLRPGEFWAVDDISFDVARGESMAIVGRNGAGKSTLLKILYGLLKPDRGEVRISGRAQAIIELGTGFNALLTGRENIEVGAALNGLGRRDTSRLIDTVIDFAEIERFIDAPVQSYSSGMKARLSYALSAHLEPDLLLVDEVLAVGDLAFQRKCVSHMRQYLERGGALLLVSHNTYQIQSVCRRGLMLERGREEFAGSAVDTLNHMYEYREANPVPRVLRPVPVEGPLVFEEVRAEGVDGGALQTGQPMRLAVRYRCRETIEASWGFGIWTGDQWICITGSYEQSGRTLEPGAGEFRCTVPRLPLLPGQYMLRAVIVDPATRLPLALFGWDDPALPLDVRGEANVVANGQRHLNQLVTLDVDWG